MRIVAAAALLVLAACAAGPDAREAEYRAEIARLRARLAAESAERQRAARREDALRRQLEAMQSAERALLDREERMRVETR